MSVTGTYLPGAARPVVDPAISGETVSPFGEVTGEGAAPAAAGQPSGTSLESPFGAGFTRQLDRSEAELFSETAFETLAELDDEDFTEALEGLVDEAAAHHVADSGAWSAAPSATQARAMLEDWIEPLAAEAERALDTLGERFAALDPESLRGSELAQLLDTAGEYTPTGNEAFDNFLGGLINKAKKAVSGAVSLAKRGIAAVGRILPIGAILGRLKALVRPLLNKVLTAAIGRLPASVQPIARTLAAKLGLGEAIEHEDDVARLAEEFDVRLAGLLLAPAEEAGTDEHEAFDGSAGEDRALGELDDARARLAERLAELPAGSNPAAEIEHFIPVVLAIKPLIKLGISMIGRDKVVGFIADRIAGLIQPMIGADAARQLSRPLVDVGLRAALGFELSQTDATNLAGESLASTVEGTVMRLTELPAEAFADELQLEAAIQTAFAEAAAMAMPSQLLRPDLPERETAGEGGVWILMPRSARPRYRYRRYTRMFAVPVSRQLARTVPWSDGGTLESYLLDRGAERWPVNAEVELYESLPGSQLGHLVPSEGEATATGAEAASELQPLTPEVAGLLLREPGLGRGRWSGAGFGGHRRPWPGRRYYRIRPLAGGVVAATAVRSPRRRVVVRLTLTDPKPALTVAIRLSERQGQQLLNRLDPAARSGGRDLPGAMADLGTQLRAPLPAAIVGRLIKHSVASDAASAGAIADRVAAAVMTALSGFLSEKSQLLAAAIRDPAPGATLTVTFGGVTKETLAAELPAGQVAVAPGWGRHG